MPRPPAKRQRWLPGRLPGTRGRATRPLAAVLAALALFGVSAVEASAAPIRECGALPRIRGALDVWNVTTRKVNCNVARIQVHRQMRQTYETGNPYWSRYLRMTCRVRRYAHLRWDTRCTAGLRVIRYQHGHR